MPVRALLLSWEYPPVVYGGLGRHVHALATALARAGHDVVVVTQHGGGDAAYDEVLDGVRVVRAPQDAPQVPRSDLLAWVMALNHGLTRTALAATRHWRPDVVHAHDWVVAYTAKAVKDALALPLVATMHATEAGRHQGWLPSPTSKAIHTIEWWLTYEARRVLTCSEHMRWEVTRLFDLPAGKVDVVPNGVEVARWRPATAEVAATRERYGAPLVVFAGRLEYEKGVHCLLRALPRLRRRHPGVRLAVAGTGSYETELRALARRLRLGRSVTFTGHLERDELAPLLAAADAVVVPSLYEPFGLVALEAAAAGAPLVVARTGGLREHVEHGRTGLVVDPDDPAGIADAVGALLRDEVLARRLRRAARLAAQRDHGWDAVSRRTAELYARAGREEEALRAEHAPLRVVVRDGNLLTGERGG